MTSVLRPSSRFRRGAAALAGAALLAGGLSAVAPAAPASAATPTESAVAWLEGRVGPDNLLNGDTAQTLDLGIRLAQSGADADLLARVRQGVDGALATYLGSTSDSTNYFKIAQAAAFYTLVGADLRNVAGIDLRSRTEAVVVDGVVDAGGFEDFYNQAAALTALQGNAATPASVETQSAIDASLARRCTGAGWGYHDDFANLASRCTSDVDSTSSMIVALLPALCRPGVADAVRGAVTWLRSQQAADGSLGLSDFLDYNANSTGLAGFAFASAGEGAAADRAAAWLRGRQVGTETGNALAGETGAIAYGDAELAKGRTDGITGAATVKEWSLATSQGFPALRGGPAAASGALAVSAPRTVRTGASVPVSVSGLTAGQPACVSLGTSSALVRGGSVVALAAPATTQAVQATVSTPTGVASAPVTALSPKVLRVRTGKSSVRAGGKQTVRVAGLVPGEKVVVRYRGKVVKRGVAPASGVYRTTIKVGRVKGKKTVRVIGAYLVRAGKFTFRVR